MKPVQDARKKYEELTRKMADRLDEQLYDYYIYTLAQDMPAASDLVASLKDTVHAEASSTVPDEYREFANWHAMTLVGKAGGVLVCVKRDVPVPEGIQKAVKYFDPEGKQTGEILASNAAVLIRIMGLPEKKPTPQLALFTAAVADYFVKLDPAIVFEPHSTRLWTRDQWDRLMDINEFDVRNFIFIHVEQKEDTCWVHTHGLKRFARPDFEVVGVPHKRVHAIAENLCNIAWYFAGGADVQAGDTVEGPNGEKLELHEATDDTGMNVEEHYRNTALRIQGYALA